jgi:poly(A) polymerase
MNPVRESDALSALLAEPAVERILRVLDADGEETRIVGGAVRNALIGVPTQDIDLATTAHPDLVMKRARRAGFQAIPTGVAHGTVTVIVDGRTFEITTLRRDVDTDGRHAIVQFDRDFDGDARRRDFTMNAMSLGRDGRLHDPVGGLDDLAARRVRFIGDARKRIAEDYLRILRLFRFHAAYGEGPLDRDALKAAIGGRHGLSRLSAERINSEMSKLLVARHATAAVADMADSGLLGDLLAGVPCVARFEQVAAIESALGVEADAVRRLAALGVLVTEDVARLRQRLRLSNMVTRRLDETAAALERFHGLRQPEVVLLNEALFRFDRTALRDALMLLHAGSGAAVNDKTWTAAHRHAATAPRPEFPISGDDLLSRGVAPGRRVGAALKLLQAQWIRAGFPRDPATLARLVDDVARREQGG